MLSTMNPSYMPASCGATIGPRQTNRRGGPQPELALVIPTLCEAQNIRALLKQVCACLDPLGTSFEILVVDDDSHDRTGEIVASIAREDSRVRLLTRKGQRGLSGAILHGWEHTVAEILAAMDADLQHPPELLPAMFASILAGRDLVLASRYVKDGDLGSWSPARKLLSRIAAMATRPIQRAGLIARDPLSGFFMVRRECLGETQFQRSGFKLLLEILVRARIQSVEEIPLIFSRRSHGVSKANLKVAWDFVRLLAGLYAGRFELTDWSRPRRLIAWSLQRRQQNP